MEKNTSLKVGDLIKYKGTICRVKEIELTFACIQREDRILFRSYKYIIPLFESKLIPIDYTKDIIHE